ncbi:MAG TPA: SpoIID/LytB domain-containing protein [Dissulfurispiraceae bacterium]|nr:SpoIID/LytB domain-containing protein [Dissulfurispiraceae bacterium]
MIFTAGSRKSEAGHEGPKIIRQGAAFLFLIFAILAFDFCLPTPALSEPSIRVLLMDGKNLKVPAKEERLTKLGSNTGDVLLSGTKYSGDIEVWKGDNGLYVINDIPLEEYIKGVVAAEVGRSWDIEAMKAQAVVARTYAVYQKLNSPAGLPYHLTSTVLDQVYKGSNVSPNIEKAVDQTKGEILVYGGKPIAAFYHSTSGGMTEDAAEVFGKEFPYLKPVKTNCELSPYNMWEKIIPAAEIEKAFEIQGVKDIVIGSHTASGRAREMQIVHENGDLKVMATELRKRLGWDRLPSTFITSISMSSGSVIFEGKGYGHGVGMCQWSALQMAREGKTYRQILSYFYHGAAIKVYEDR